MVVAEIWTKIWYYRAEVNLTKKELINNNASLNEPNHDVIKLKDEV